VWSRSIATGLLALAAAAGLVLPGTACLDEHGRGVAALVYMAGSAVCHQRAERSLSSCGRPWPVCGRCSGLYLGAAAGALLAAAGVRGGTAAAVWRQRLVWAAAPTAISWLAEAAGFLDPGTPLRFVLAVPLGVATALWLAEVARGHLR
jgi:uncharacterized membrane protein